MTPNQHYRHDSNRPRNTRVCRGLAAQFGRARVHIASLMIARVRYLRVLSRLRAGDFDRVRVFFAAASACSVDFRGKAGLRGGFAGAGVARYVLKRLIESSMSPMPEIWNHFMAVLPLISKVVSFSELLLLTADLLKKYLARTGSAAPVIAAMAKGPVTSSCL